MNHTSRMPALFLGHGSPMNVLENNPYTQAWQALGETLPRPKAIVAVSAHWYTRGTAVTAMEKPRTIHDFGGFPQALFDTQYPAPGSPELAEKIQRLLAPIPVAADGGEWGLDHGAWGVLIKMYPQADIPVVQLSVDGTQPAGYHYQLGRKLAALRDEGIMIVASGNVVHNLRMVKWNGEAEPYPWAVSFNQFVRDNLSYQGDNHPLVNFMQHEGAALSNPTPDHYLPLLYVLGSWDGKEAIGIPVDGIEMGSLSMLSVQVG
ncbi:4,5-DOPA dioxygenase extradiol [Brenneria tiliae]|uniref:4,5-DOPA dioxygenase extradiol n=1 Tax=Brenneria tiliae TaxID=2914984 RepID=A0ABT0MT93_9GAMM|nr:4,5-DOPA dioxygenase extradiol [Brenneria tiliae]MCL2892792.1 4,5-DOPA dioxygenase extradiol [Brenneria tiliae]